MLPVVQRELLVTSRKWTPFLLRVCSALAAVTVMAGMIAAGQGGVMMTDSGLPLFRILTTIAFWCVYFGGAMLTADCLTLEAREGTLGLLFLTDLKGYDVVLGKLVARSLTGFFCLLAIVPVLAIPILVGGVSAAEFWRVVTVLVMTMLFSASIGMAVSVLFKGGTGVFTAAGLLIGALGLASPILEIILRGSDAVTFRSFIHLAWLLQPSAAFGASAAGRFAGAPAVFYMSLGSTALLSICFLSLASWKVTTAWQTRPARGIWVGFEQFCDRFTHGNAVQRRGLRQRLLGIHPIVWLHSRRRLMPAIVTGFLLVLIAVTSFANWLQFYPWSQMGPALVPMIFLQASLMAMVACEAADHLAKTKYSGATEIILCTPLTTRDMVDGHVLTLRHLFRWPFMAVISYGVLWLITAEIRAPRELKIFALVAAICLSANLAVCCRAIALCALNSSVRQQRVNHAATRALAAVVALPWIWYWMATWRLPTALDSPIHRFIMFTVLSVANACLLDILARRRLYADFREALALSAAPRERS